MKAKTISSVEELNSFYSDVIKDDTILVASVYTNIRFNAGEVLPESISVLFKDGENVYETVSVLEQKQQEQYFHYLQHAMRTHSCVLNDAQFLMYKYYIKNGHRVSLINDFDSIICELTRRKGEYDFAIYVDRSEGNKNELIQIVNLKESPL